MLSDATQTTRRLAIFTPFGKDKLLLTHVEGVESMSSLFEFRLTMLSTDGALHGADVLGRNVTFLIRDHKGTVRWFNGFVNRFSCSGVTADVFSYKASVVPWLWFLTQTSDCRIFQDMSALEIIEKSFNDLGFHDFDTSGLTSTYPKREYCVQYRETDFNFISRLMEEEGIHYFFRHDNGRHEMVLADDNSIFADIINANDVEMGDPNSSGDLEEQVTHWNHDYSFVAGTFSQTDFDFKEPQKRLMRSVSTSLPLKDAVRFDVYEYPGRYDQRKVGQRLARVRMQQQEVQHNVIKGAGNYLTFMPGGLFRLKSHLAQSEVGKQFALIEVMHSAELGDSYGIGNLPENDSFVYRSEFRCVPAAVPFRPQRIAAKPTVEGVQTAIVVGPKGEQIFPDKFGRVKVQFHWDREGGRDENSSCWMRVSQVHAGAGWGMIDLPRIGEEVIVSFLDGDPDRPIIKGRVYNAEARVPFGLPGQMTRSGGKSNTHKGSGYNEVTADDTAGAEQIRMNAQFNMDTTIGNNETLKVGVDRTGNIGNNDSLTVAVDSTTDIGNNQTTTVGVNATYDISNEITITAGTAITLQCGMSTIHMNQAGVITISGQFVSSLAKATNSIVAPMTEIAGSKLLNLGGLVCLDLSGVKHIKGGETTVSAPTINIDGGVVVVKGCPIEIGEVGAPVVAIPVPLDSLPTSLTAGVMSVVNSVASPILRTAVQQYAQQYLTKIAGSLLPKELAAIVATFGPISGLVDSALPFLTETLKKLWNLPNTALGLVWGGLGHIAGETKQAVGSIFGVDYPEPEIDFFENGSNAIEFHDNLFMTSAITLGNVIIYGGEGNGVAGDLQLVPVYDEKGKFVINVKHDSYGTVRDHEREHTLQGEDLGPLYIPYALGSYLYGGIHSMISQGSFTFGAFNEGTHGPHSSIEYGPQSSPPTRYGGSGPPTYNSQTRTFSNLPPRAIFR